MGAEAGRRDQREPVKAFGARGKKMKVGPEGTLFSWIFKVLLLLLCVKIL